MKRMRTGILATASAAALAFAGQAWAQSNSGTTSASPNGSGVGNSTGPNLHSGNGEYEATTGRVENVDPKQQTVSIAGSGRDLQLNQNTMVIKDGINTNLDSVKPGDDVRAVFLEGHDLHPYKLEVSSPKAKKSSNAASSGTGSSSSGTQQPGTGSSIDSGIGPPRQ